MRAASAEASLIFHAAAVEKALDRPIPLRGAEPDPDQANRLARRSTARPGDPADRHANLRAHRPARALSHLEHALPADRAMRLQGARPDAKQALFGLIRVGGNASQVIVRRSGDIGNPVADQPTRARFGRRQPQTTLPEQLT